MPRRLKIVNYLTFMLAVTWVWSVGEGLGFMWSTGIGHHKNTHRNRRSDWLVVKRRDCHYQVILGKKDHIFVSSVCQKTGLIQQLRLFSEKLKGITIIPTCIYLMEKIHVNLCFSLPGIIIWEFKKIWEGLYTENHSHSYNATDKRNCYNTCNVLLKNNFGSFKEVLSDYKNFLASFHWAAVETLSQDLWHACWLSWRVKEDSNYH